MKRFYKQFATLSILISLSSCDPDTQDTQNDFTNFLKAAIYETCQTGINFNGEDIYSLGFRSDVFGSYKQLGGHPANASNQLPDLGINIVVEELETGFYNITDHYVSGKAFIYYIDENGYEYNSTNSSSTVFVEIMYPPGGKTIEVRFNNVELYNPTLDKTICVNSFSYFYGNQIVNL